MQMRIACTVHLTAAITCHSVILYIETVGVSEETLLNETLGCIRTILLFKGRGIVIWIFQSSCYHFTSLERYFLEMSQFENTINGIIFTLHQKLLKSLYTGFVGDSIHKFMFLFAPNILQVIHVQNYCNSDTQQMEVICLISFSIEKDF